MLQKLREPISGLTHLGGAIASVIGLVVLLYVSRGGIVKEISLLIYGSSLVLMFSSSAAYHLIKSEPRVVRCLRRLDHSAIYFLIAGTYTPICLHFFDGFWRWGPLLIVWLMALAGIAVKLFIAQAPRWLNVTLYLLMGWLCLAAIQEMLSVMPMGALAWLLAGGLFFTAGAIVYMVKKPDLYPGVFGFHEVWHIFVILGCASHYILIAAFVAQNSAPIG